MDNVYDYNRLGSRFNKIVSLLIIIVLSFLIFYFVTYSWFGESEKGNKVIVVGQIKLDVKTNLKFPSDTLEPNKLYENMETIIGCVKDTDQAYIKVKFETDYKINDNYIIKPVLYVSEEFEADGKQNWIYSEVDDCYYYVGFISPDNSATFNTGFVVTNDINNVDKSKPVNIKLTVYAIQRHFKAYETEPNWAGAPQEWKTEIAAFDITN